MSAEARAERGVAPNRIEGLADAVFAIVLTLLVIDIHAPRATSTAALATALGDLWPDLLSYGISFVVLAFMWFGHRMEFHYITRMDRTTIAASLLFLGTVTFLPFTSSLMEKNFDQPLAVAIFGFNLFAATALRWWHWHHASTDYRLLRNDTPAAMVAAVRLRSLLVPILYLMACAVCAVSIPFAIVMFLMTPAVYVVPASLDPTLNPV